MSGDRTSREPRSRAAVASQREIDELAAIEAAIPSCSGWTSPARHIVTRMVAAAGDLGLAALVQMHTDAVEAGTEALRSGCALVCDVPMVAAGVSDGGIRMVTAATSKMADPDAWKLRLRQLAAPLDGGIAVFGQEPKALTALLDLVDEGVASPAVIVGTPAGFAGAVEAKERLVNGGLPFITVLGSRGGAPLAAAAANALLLLAAQ